MAWFIRCLLALSSGTALRAAAMDWRGSSCCLMSTSDLESFCNVRSAMHCHSGYDSAMKKITALIFSSLFDLKECLRSAERTELAVARRYATWHVNNVFSGSDVGNGVK